MSTKIEFDSRKDYYAILGVNEDVTSDELKTARKNLVLQYHPDVNPSLDAAIKFRAIQDAYEVLSDPHTRTSYESARNSLLKKVIAQETMLTTGFVTQRDNFQAVKRGVSAGGVQESTNSRFKDAAWQKLPLAAKKAARTTNVRSGIAINLFALSVVGGVLFVDQCVIPRLSMLGSDDDTL